MPHAGLPVAVVDSPPALATVAAEQLTLGGWLLDPVGPIEIAYVLVDGKVAGPVRLGLARPDVGAVFPGVEHGAATGWEAAIDLQSYTAPTISVSLLVGTASRQWLEVFLTTYTVERPSASGKKARAVFTIAQNEPTFLPLWVQHYKRWFEAEDVFVLDHDSNDGSTDAVRGSAEIVPVHRSKSFDHNWLSSTVGSFQRFLLRSYDTVLFAESDELIVADPDRYEGLDDYIRRLDRPAARCTGFNVVQQPEEMAVDFSRPVLAQRRAWHSAPQYSKRLLSRIPLHWTPGFHDETAAPPDPPDPNLVLIHLHRVDFDTCLARHQGSAARNWSERDIQDSRGWQNRITEPGSFAEWFHHGSDIGSPDPIAIPERFRTLI